MPGPGDVEPVGEPAPGAAVRGVGPTAVADRALAPDLARGAMLLLIALANAQLFLFGHPAGFRGYPSDGTVADRVVTLVQMTLVDGRAYPLFAALFGYGLVQLARSRTAAGLDEEAVQGLVRRRGVWLVAFGCAHGLLLFSGDIAGAYGLLAVAGAEIFLRARDPLLLRAAAVWVLFAAMVGALDTFPLPEDQVAYWSLAETDPLRAAGYRVPEWLFAGLVGQAFVFVAPAVLVGVWAARRRLLETPERHRRLLRRTAAGGLGLAVAGGLPLALLSASVLRDPPLAVGMLAGFLHGASGYAGGLGYAALAGLAAARIRRRGPAATALAALGQRSLTFYLAQSVVFVATLAAYGGGLGDQLGVAATALLATATWAATLLAATAMHHFHSRGPAETLLRRLTYQPPSPTSARR